MAKRLTVSIDDETAALLRDLAGGARKQGAYLEGLIRAAAAQQGTAVADPAAPLRSEACRVASELTALAHRLLNAAGAN